jgi:hypothetical protein
MGNMLTLPKRVKWVINTSNMNSKHYTQSSKGIDILMSGLYTVLRCANGQSTEGKININIGCIYNSVLHWLPLLATGHKSCCCALSLSTPFSHFPSLLFLRERHSRHLQSSSRQPRPGRPPTVSVPTPPPGPSTL